MLVFLVINTSKVTHTNHIKKYFSNFFNKIAYLLTFLTFITFNLYIYDMLQILIFFSIALILTIIITDENNLED